MRPSLALVALLPALACATPPPPAPPEERVLIRQVDAARAYQDVENLVAIGERESGTEGIVQARAYLRSQLEQLGLEVREVAQEAHRVPAEGEEGVDREAFDLVHLVAEIPAAGTPRSDSVILLGAAYDTEPQEEFVNVAANGSASGPALVLELARAIHARPLAYPTWIVLLDGEFGGRHATLRVGSQAWVNDLRENGQLDRVRLGFFFRQVCDPDLQFERDIYSHRSYREALWKAARRQDATAVFPPGAGFDSPPAAHLSLIDGGVRRVVAVVDNRFGGNEAPGALAGTADDNLENCSAESMRITGDIVLDALDELSARFAKVDRLSPPDPEEPGPETAEAAAVVDEAQTLAEEPEASAAPVEPAPPEAGQTEQVFTEEAEPPAGEAVDVAPTPPPAEAPPVPTPDGSGE